MEFGRKCQFTNCNIVDFLPFYCRECNKYYCLNHRTYCSHNCINNPNNRQNKIIKKKKKKYICNFPNCNKRGIILSLCNKCNKYYCIKHRFHDLHYNHTVLVNGGGIPKPTPHHNPLQSRGKLPTKTKPIFKL